MTLFDDLLKSTQFAQAKPIWQEGQAQAVFEPFFACVLVGMMDDAYLLWIQNFIAHTQKQAMLSLTTKSTSFELDKFWTRQCHKILLDKLVQKSAVPIDVLEAALPLAVHTGYQVLMNKAADKHLIPSVLTEHLSESVSYLPSWADEVLGDELIAMVSVESLLAQSIGDLLQQDTVAMSAKADGMGDKTPKKNETIKKNDTPIHPLYEPDTINHPPKSTALQQRAIIPVLLGVMAIAIIAAVAYYYVNTQNQADKTADTSGLVAPAVKSLPPSMLSITVGQAGELYACHAELGNVALSDELVRLLQTSFGATMCIIDIDDDIQQTMPHFDKLKSIIALLKSAPYATLQLYGDVVYINAPNPDDITRLVTDIGALMSEVTVLSMPNVDSLAVVQQSLDKAKQALETLPDNATDFELAKAMSLQRFDVTQGFVPEANRAILAKAATFLQNRPETRLIIVVHSDDVGDEQTAQSQTQATADAIKTELVANGVLAEQLVAKGVGAKFPFADNQTATGRFYNRRVEFLVYDDSVMQALNHAQMNISDAGLSSMGEGSLPTYAVVDGQIVEQVMPTISDEIATSDEITTVYSEHPLPLQEQPPRVEPQRPSYVPQRPPVSSQPSMEGIEDLLNIGSDPAIGQASQINVN